MAREPQLAPNDPVHEAIHVGRALILVLPDGIRFEIVCKKLVCPQRVLLLPALAKVVAAVVFKPDAGAVGSGEPQDDVGPSDVGLVEKLEAMTCVCSVGLDMIAVPGDTTAETLAAIIADEAAIGMVNSKTTAVRLIPAPGKKVGDTVEFGGLLGSAPVIPVHPFSSAAFIQRGGRIPAPMQSLKN